MERQQMLWGGWRAHRPSWLAWIGRHELGTLIFLTLAALIAWGFAELAEEVVEGATARIDRAIILAMRDPRDPSNPVGPGGFEEMVRDISGLGSIAVLLGLTLAVAGYLALERKRHAMVLVLVAVFGGLIATIALKHGFARSRPEIVPHGGDIYTASFPSGH